jgi:Bacterial Ig-like domain
VDQRPPLLIAVFPESLAVLPHFSDQVEFRFDEVISEGGAPNFGLGTGDLEKLVILSPSLAVPEVHWHRTRITVKPREGWQPNTVYRIELLPGLPDLSNNRAKAGATVTFSTGAPLPTDTLRGRIVDWSTQRPQPRGLVEAILLPDSLSYRTSADSTGRFVLGPVPRGSYLVYGVLDLNKNFRFEPRESFDTVRLAAGRDSVGELWAFRRDTTAARITTATANDSVSLALTFSQPLNPYQQLPAESVEVRLLPDSLLVPVLRMLPRERYDSAFPRLRPVDTSAAGRAKADSLRADSVRQARADSIRTDSIARARAAVRLRIPGVEQGAPAATDTAGRGPLRTKPAPYDRLFVRMRDPLQPGGVYVVTVHGIENLSRVAGSPVAVAKAPEAKPPADTTRVKPDTGRVRVKPDTGRGRLPPGPPRSPP